MDLESNGGGRLETRLESEAFRVFAHVASAVTNPDIENWKAGGGKVLGYFCSAMPEELAAAAGILPVRLRATGSAGTELSDAYLGSINCTYPRHALNMALQGEYAFIDGLVMFNSCDHIRRLYDHWIRELPTPFVRILSLPRKAEPPQVEWFHSELIQLKDGIQTHFGVEITDDKLRAAIKAHNERRRLLREIYQLRKMEKPPITGAEALAVTVGTTALPVERSNTLLRALLTHLQHSQGVGGYRARLMLMGGELDNPQYIQVIEDQGGLVVADSLCFGSRLFWKEVDESAEDPLRALAQYYVVDRPSCARVFTEYENRSQYVRSMMEEFNVDGAIFERLTFCELWGFEQLSMTNDFKAWGIPLLCMDREYTLSAVGQLRTRVQAFLETIEG
jgi:benzoyl-CoA reductase subunit C